MDDTSARGTRCGTDGRAVVVCALIILWVAVSGQTLRAQPVTHPMDPLTAAEYSAAVALLKAANHVNDDSRYPMITLHEPVKSEVLRWKLGDPVPRAAFLIIKHGPQIALFDPNADPAVNYGGVGGVIGHEMGHGYDDQGAKSDENGVLHLWWKHEDEVRPGALAPSMVSWHADAAASLTPQAMRRRRGGRKGALEFLSAGP